MEKFIADSGFVVAFINSSELILEQYADSKVDFVDASIMAIAERLDIRTVLTIDQRDFRLFQPSHCQSFILQP